MKWRALLPVVFLAGLACALPGCSSETTHGTVHGTVTLDGAPLEKRLIRFVPADGQSATADAIIKDGTFTARVPVGEKQVSISAPKVVGKRQAYETPDSPTVDITEELLPKRYNVQSTLTITVAAGQQQEDFKLTSGN